MTTNDDGGVVQAIAELRRDRAFGAAHELIRLRDENRALRMQMAVVARMLVSALAADDGDSEPVRLDDRRHPPVRRCRLQVVP